jgi:hypothetical protein
MLTKYCREYKSNVNSWRAYGNYDPLGVGVYNGYGDAKWDKFLVLKANIKRQTKRRDIKSVRKQKNWVTLNP